MCNANPCCTRTVASQRRCVSAMPFAGEAIRDLLPCPPSMPCSVNQYECLAQNVFLPHWLGAVLLNRDRQMTQIQQPAGIFSNVRCFTPALVRARYNPVQGSAPQNSLQVLGVEELLGRDQSFARHEEPPGIVLIAAQHCAELE